METVVQRPPEPEPVPPVNPEPLPPAGPKKNTLAIVSLVLGIVGIISLCLSAVFFFIPFAGWICGCLTLLFGIGALVTGFMARNQIKTTDEQGDGMALAGMVMGGIQLVLVVCSIFVILIVTLLGPSIGSVFSSINSSLK